MTTLTIPKEMTRKGDLVIIPRKEYEEFLEFKKRIAIPHYQLKGKEAEELDKLVEEGLKEYREGKTELMENFLKREYPKLYEFVFQKSFNY